MRGYKAGDIFTGDIYHFINPNVLEDTSDAKDSNLTRGKYGVVICGYNDRLLWINSSKNKPYFDYKRYQKKYKCYIIRHDRYGFLSVEDDQGNVGIKGCICCNDIHGIDYPSRLNRNKLNKNKSKKKQVKYNIPTRRIDTLALEDLDDLHKHISSLDNKEDRTVSFYKSILKSLESRIAERKKEPKSKPH